MSNAQRKATENEVRTYEAAKAAAYGEVKTYNEPNQPSDVEQLCQDAIASFRTGRICNGYDLLEQAEKIARLD